MLRKVSFYRHLFYSSNSVLRMFLEFIFVNNYLDDNIVIIIIINVFVKGKGSSYSITERRAPELMPVLGSQPTGDVLSLIHI